MTGLIVPSDSRSNGNKLDKAVIPRGADSANGSGNAAAGFAAILSVSTNQHVNPKGQSSKDHQELDKKQNTKGTVQCTQKQNVLGNIQGYGNFVPPFLTQLLLQSELPAGKEANSGNEVSQGKGILPAEVLSLSNASSLTAGNNLALISLRLLRPAADEVSAQSGMTRQKAQGDPPVNMELDKYRQVITDLLERLSGEITEISPKNHLTTDSNGTMALRQNYANLIQGWLTVMDETVNNGQAPGVQKGIQALFEILKLGTNPDNSEKSGEVSARLVSFYPTANLGFKNGITSQGINETQPAVAIINDTIHTPVKQILTPKSLLESLTLDNIQGKNQDTHQGNSTQTIKSSASQDGQNLNFSLNLGAISNGGVLNTVDGKTPSLPVWEQISSILHEQILNRSQDIKKLDIQLHPEDLGRIQIDLHWENGQVHLQVQASQAATGQLLQNHISDLRQALESQGINCGLLQMGQGGEKQRNSQDSQQTFKQKTSAEDEDIQQVNNALYPEDNGLNQINVTA